MDGKIIIFKLMPQANIVYKHWEWKKVCMARTNLAGIRNKKEWGRQAAGEIFKGKMVSIKCYWPLLILLNNLLHLLHFFFFYRNTYIVVSGLVIDDIKYVFANVKSENKKNFIEWKESLVSAVVSYWLCYILLCRCNLLS